MMWMFFFFFFFFNLKDIIFFNFFFFLEGPAMFLCAIVVLIASLIMFFKFNKFGSLDNLLYSFMFFLILIFVSLSFFCNAPFFFILFLEMCVYPMSFLIINFSKDQDKYLSTLFMFSINILGSIPFMLFSSFFSNIFLFESLVCFHVLNFNCVSFLFFFFFLLILVSKLPLLFFHFWLTKAHVSASSSCSMVLASLMLKLGSFGLYKFSLLFLFSSLLFMVDFFSISLMSCIFFCFLMIRFFDLKYLIACSSILHMSLIFPLICLSSSQGLISSMFMMVGHGLVSYYLFFLISLFYEFSLNRSMDFNKSLESFSKISSMYFFFFIFMNLGFPPLINFYSELIFCLNLLSYSFFSTLIFFVSMIMSILFVMFLISKTIFGKKFMFSTMEYEYLLNFVSFKFLFVLVILPFLF